MGSRGTPLIVGVDVGGSGIKAAAVDTATGRLATPRVRVATPVPATPDAVAAATAALVAGVAPGRPAGIGVPAVVRDGTALTAANIDPAWVGAPVERLFADRLGRRCAVVNDADAAGIAEMRFGAGCDAPGTVLVLTLGTGIGSALFVDGTLVPNTELGHLELGGVDAESRAAASARDREGLSWKRWAKRLDRYLRHVEDLLWPDLVILGGGASKAPERFMPHLGPHRARIVPAVLGNQAGIVGAALWAREHGAAAARRPAARGPATPG
ncbi:MAG: polyphosphate--glucose phosphotransferase [Actinomycetota bacterium]